MPRNASGIYTLPEPPVVASTVIASVPENSTRSDIGAEITNSLDRSGRGGMLASLRLFDGTEALPGVAFGLDTNSGIYRSGADAWYFVANGVAKGGVTATGMIVVTQNTGLRVWDSDQSNVLSIVPGSNLTADRIFTLLTGDVARTLDLSLTSFAPSVFGASLIDDANAAAARTTLDVPSNAEAILDTLIDAAGDLIVGMAADTVARLAIGTAGQVLQVNAGATAPAWSMPGFTTGDVKLTLKIVADSGWVLCNDGTIGNAASGGTTRANADTVDLFTLLWNNVADAQAAVSGGRGASAAADYAANKTIALTKMLGRAFGASGAGSGLTSRVLGLTTGAETVTLATAEMAAHTHSYATRTIDGTYTLTRASDAGSDAGDKTTSSTGGGGAHANMQPTAFVNAMIKL